MRQSRLRVLAAAGMVLAIAVVLVAILVAGLTDKYAANRDFIEYWAAAQQLVHHQNPYEAADILRIERGAGMDDPIPR